MIVRREALKAVLAATTDTDHRYQMSAVQIRPDGTIAATNGHVAFVATDKTPFPDEDFPQTDPPYGGPIETAVLMERTVADGLIAATAKKATIPILTAIQVGKNGGSGGAVAVATDLESPRTAKLPVDGGGAGTFPKLDRVMPTKDRPAIRLSLSTAVLARIIKAAEATGKTKTDGATVSFYVQTGKEHQQDGAIVSAVRAEVNGTDVSLVMAVMPIRV
jgi:hypothetical protein